MSRLERFHIHEYYVHSTLAILGKRRKIPSTHILNMYVCTYVRMYILTICIAAVLLTLKAMESVIDGRGVSALSSFPLSSLSPKSISELLRDDLKNCT